MGEIIRLGQKVRDEITGFAGVAVGRFVYLYGCVRVEVQPAALDKDGKRRESLIFDEGQLQVVDAAGVSPPPLETSTGGPRAAPSSRPDPVR